MGGQIPFYILVWVVIVLKLNILSIVKRTLFTGQTNVSKEGFLRAINLVKL
jgi:hypothetical protein